MKIDMTTSPAIHIKAIGYERTNTEKILKSRLKTVYFFLNLRYNIITEYV